MKNKYIYINMLLMFIFPYVSFGQTYYNLTFGNNQNYYTTCGDNNASQWTVTFDHKDCFLYTPILNPVGSGMVGISYSFRVNQAGNNTVYDTLQLELYTPNDGWEVIHTVLGNQYNEVNFDITGDLTVDATDYIVFRLHAIVTVSNSFWAIKKDNTNFTVINVTPTTDYLPVTLTSFSGYSENNHAEIQWTTYSETNNNFFTIERSENNALFYPAGFVKGAGNSNFPIEYSFTDPEELTSDITYYRLRQTDFDGSAEVFNTIAVKKNLPTDHRLWFHNDQSSVQIYYETDQEEKIVLSIFDSTGKCVFRNQINTHKGINTFSWSSLVKNTEKGLYFISITDPFSKGHYLKLLL